MVGVEGVRPTSCPIRSRNRQFGLARPKSISLAPDFVSMMFGGLEVAMNDALAVAAFQRLAIRCRQSRLGNDRGPFKSVRQGLAFQQLHDEESTPSCEPTS